MTFLTGGLALPVAALIGIGVGATGGALTGGLGMYHGKAKDFKQYVADNVKTAVGEQKQEEEILVTDDKGLRKVLEMENYFSPKQQN